MIEGKKLMVRLGQLIRKHPWVSAGVLLVVLLAFYQLVGVVQAALEKDETWARIQRERVVRIGTDASYPPFEVVTAQGVFEGYDVDLAQALSARWGVDVQFVNVHFDGLYDALTAGKCDMIISALPYDRTMTRDLAYSQSYFDAGQVLLLAATVSMPEEPGALVGRIAVELGSEGHLVARRLVRDDGLQAEIVALRETDLILRALESGEAEAAIVDRVTAMKWLARDSALKAMPVYLTSDPYVIAVPAEAIELLDQVDTALAEWRDSGLLAEIEQRWLGAP